MAAADMAVASAMGMRPMGGRRVVVVSSDAGLRERLRASLTGMRWHVLEASGGAAAIGHVEEQAVEAMLIDGWLPDLEAGEVAARVLAHAPETEVLRVDGSALPGSLRSSRRHELLHALREAAEAGPKGMGERAVDVSSVRGWEANGEAEVLASPDRDAGQETSVQERRSTPLSAVEALPAGIDEMIGRSAVMMELTRMVRLVAPRSTTVLIEGETGTGKEVVAKAVHRLSARAQKPFAVLNCAAIPEALLEAELFGHTRGAFTGADRARIGRIEAAHGGTLFLDEIGEMPLALQAKMLRFLESGEIQRVGDNDMMQVDVRVIAATHQLLEKRSAEGTFRLDLYHRLAVFPVEVPPLRERLEDIAELAEHFLAALGRRWPRKTLSAAALARLQVHTWPGNVRELAHVLERAAILAGERSVIGVEDVQMRRARC
jgi:DNA-binding NtrC family response regulator